jgi:hypothetical protein
LEKLGNEDGTAGRAALDSCGEIDGENVVKLFLSILAASNFLQICVISPKSTSESPL